MPVEPGPAPVVTRKPPTRLRRAELEAEGLELPPPVKVRAAAPARPAAEQAEVGVEAAEDAHDMDDADTDLDVENDLDHDHDPVQTPAQVDDNTPPF